MAAILCNACCVQPCKACSTCCDSCSNALASMCGGMCSCCNDACQWFNNFFTEPLSCFVLLATLWMGLVGLTTILSITEDLEGCAGPMMVWFIVALLQCVVHVLYAFYCYNRIKSRDKAVENYFMVLYQLLVHDPWTALYMVFDIFGVIWSFLGFSWDNGCPEEVSTYSSLAAWGLLLYIAASYFAMISNLFSESVQNDMCFCLWCLPFMMFPCCFGPCLRRSYERQRGQNRGQSSRNQPAIRGAQPRYLPAFPGGNNGTQGANSQSYQWHPVPPQVSGRPQTQNPNQGESPGLLRTAAGAVGSILWDRTVNRNNRQDRRARV